MVKTLPLLEALKTLRLPELSRNLFASAEWMRVIQKTYQSDLFVKYIERDGKVVSYIFYSVVKNFLEWKICVCSYCDYCDCPVQSAEDWQAIFESLRAEFPRYRIAIRNLRDSIIRDNPHFQILSKERFHILDARKDQELLWKQTHDSFKSAVKQGEKNGITVRSCSQGELKDFYRLHLNLRKFKYRIFPQPYRFFENIWQEYMDKDKGILLGAFDPNGEMLAANIYLICGNTLYYKFNTSSLAALNLRPNNLLFWEGIKFAKARQLDFLDMGSSGWDQKGLVLFKDHTGADCKDIVHLGFTPEGYKFSQKRILKVITRFFTLPWMPEPLVKFGSDLVYPYLA